MLAACNAIGCAFPGRREAVVWGVLGVIVGLVALLAVVSASAGRLGVASASEGHGAPLASVVTDAPDQPGR